MPDRSSPPTQTAFPIVGIGASAGGLEAVRSLFEPMPVDLGVGFVLVQHLDPTHDSVMAELIGKSTQMPVVRIEDGMRIEPNRLHVIPPNAALRIVDGVLRLQAPSARRGQRMPIDEFFVSLAEDRHTQAIGIVLSGTGSDGAAGVAMIKAHGGMLMAQQPASAGYDGMPLSAIATGHVDYVFPPAEMAEVLASYIRHLRNDGPDVWVSGQDRRVVDNILELIEARLGQDFQWYKRATLGRRIRRRMGLVHETKIPDYHRRLCSDDEELRALTKDLLISVTAFFRDPEAWNLLAKEVVPELLRRCPSEQPLRVWVPGCATGEEAYSIAMLLLESMEAAGREPNLIVFATDVDTDALRTARAGIYTANLMTGLDPERIARFFDREGAYFQVKKCLREHVVVASQNLIRDPPFSNIDLISCRHLLIYIEAKYQQRILSVFDFALREGGYLFLSTSESVGQRQDLFTPVSEKWRIYRRSGGVRTRALPIPMRTVRHQTLEQRSGANDRRRLARGYGPTMQNALLRHFTPAAVLVDRHNRVLCFHGAVRDYLGPSAGDPTDDLLCLVAEELRGKVRAALRQAIEQGATASVRGARMRRGSAWQRVRIHVTPVDEDHEHEASLLVVFEDEPLPAEQAGDGEHADLATLASLEEELRSTREELQTTIEQMDISSENLQASNEEAMSMNEELQSTNEELETSKEELQSLNEELVALNSELVALNSELAEKLSELQEINDDLRNLLTSSDVATLFLDQRLNLRRCTPAARALFKLGPSDIGRAMPAVTHCIGDPDLLKDAARILVGAQVCVCEVQGADGQWYQRRMLPYTTDKAPVMGVVITFTEITDLKRAQLTSADSLRTLRRLTDAMPALIARVDRDLRYTFNNAAYEHWFGMDREQIRGQRADELAGSDVIDLVRTHVEQALAGTDTQFEAWMPFQGVGVRYCHVEYIPDKRANGEVTGFFTLVSDITERRRNEESIERLNAENRARVAEMRALFDTAPIGIYVGRDIDCVDMEMNQAGAEILRLPRASNPSLSGPASGGLSFRIFHEGRELSAEELPMQVAARTGELVRHFEEDILFEDGEVKHLVAAAAPLRDDAGKVYGCVGVLADMTAAKRSERQHLETLERLELHMDNSPVASLEWGADTGIKRWSPAAQRVFGWREEEVIQRSLHDLELFSEEQAEQAANMIGDLLSRRLDHNRCLHRNRTKSGEIIWCEWHNSALRDGDGRLVSVLSLAMDVTEQQQLEASLRRQTARLAEADRRKNEFLSMLGHELRNPLAPVRNALDLLSLGGYDPTTRDWAYTVIDRQTRHLERLVHDLLDVARITRGVIELRLETHDLGELVREAFDALEHRIRARGHEVALELPSKAVLVQGDATRLVQVLTNVLHNAVKYTDEGGYLRVALTACADVALVVIEDNGQGIEPEIIPGLFDAFTQGPRSLARSEGGLGLGLMLVQNIIGLHGGQVDIHSAGPGLGTRVTLTLPLHVASETDMPADLAADLTPTPPPCKRVLVVDDNPELLDAISRLLGMLGHQVSTAATGHEALEQVRASPPELMLLDIGLPDIDGIEVARRLAELPQRQTLKLIAVSGYGPSALGKELSLFDEHLLKPLGLEDLKRLLA